MKLFVCLIVTMLSLLSLSSAFRVARPLLARSKLTLLMSTGHGAPSNAPAMSPEDEKIVAAFRENQSNQKRISFAEEVRTLLDQSIGFGTLSTNSQALPGYPTGSVVGFQMDAEGMPYFVFSTMSAHTTDILKDGRCSLTVMSKDFKGAAEGRVVLVGSARKVFDEDKKAALREDYLKRHTGAYWIDFGDFAYFQMEQLEAVRFVGGFAMAGSITPEEYKAARPDPLAAFAGAVLGHMNDDHSTSTVDMVKHFAGVDCSEATIVGLDRLGLTVKAKLMVAGGGYSKVRLSFPQEVLERKGVKDAIVQMTQASAGAQ
eukprot:CAMPEP_0173342996 /NCGR_PEP_ID=MMETSP1144-20121109/10539_1 /TAXON_ID=483371 /ORGANISM="non described non described, Strain CCMP2298" /LENGTH=315 /DNA_ID=CAMNT_0014289695 /DNA_START=65 /DNA_END=1012 /DNA_ORIENTATION=+